MSHKSSAVSKEVAAKIQLETAIWLWFNDGDLVSIITLAGAAHDIFDGLLHHKKRRRAVPFAQTPAGMTPRQWRNFIKEDYVFGKHARTDPEKTREYDPEVVEAAIFFAIASLLELSGFEELHGLIGLFMAHSLLRHPAPVPSDSFKQLMKIYVPAERFENLSPADFFQEFGGAFVNPPRIG